MPQRPCASRGGANSTPPAFTEKVLAFCADRGATRHTANALAHCVEETVVNIICSGFLDGRPHCIDLRVVAKGCSFILRARDDCHSSIPRGSSGSMTRRSWRNT